jgi:hypothetical protein
MREVSTRSWIVGGEQRAGAARARGGAGWRVKRGTGGGGGRGMPRGARIRLPRAYWNSVASWPAAGRSEFEMTSPFTVTVGVAMP